jgi:hypothetical protein
MMNKKLNDVIPISCWKCNELMFIDASLGFDLDSKILCDGCIQRGKIEERDKKIVKVLSKKWYERIFS